MGHFKIEKPRETLPNYRHWAYAGFMLLLIALGIGLSYTRFGGPLIAILNAAHITVTFTGVAAIAANVAFLCAIGLLLIMFLYCFEVPRVSSLNTNLQVPRYEFNGRIDMPPINPAVTKTLQKKLKAINLATLKKALFQTKIGQADTMPFQDKKPLEHFVIGSQKAKNQWIYCKSQQGNCYTWLDENSLGVPPGWYRILTGGNIIYGGFQQVPMDPKTSTDPNHPFSVEPFTSGLVAFQPPSIPVDDDGNVSVVFTGPWMTIHPITLSMVKLGQANTVSLPQC